MKRILICILAILLTSNFLFANSKRAVSPVYAYWSAGSTAIVYGDNAIVERNDKLSDMGLNRIVLSGDVGVGFRLDERMRFITGANIAYDGYLSSSQSVHYLDYSFFCGIRVYPGLGGLNCGLEYNMGQRTNFYQLIDFLDNPIQQTSWGNGFRFLIEYDFSYFTKGFAPVVGASWRSMPRGGYSDQLFGFYLRLTL